MLDIVGERIVKFSTNTSHLSIITNTGEYTVVCKALGWTGISLVEVNGNVLNTIVTNVEHSRTVYPHPFGFAGLNCERAENIYTITTPNGSIRIGWDAASNGKIIETMIVTKTGPFDAKRS